MGEFIFLAQVCEYVVLISYFTDLYGDQCQLQVYGACLIYGIPVESFSSKGLR